MAIEIVDNVYLRSARSTGNKLDIWFLHGFGESGLSFQEAFSSRLKRHYNLFAPDFPGFGASPPRRAGKDLKASWQVLRSLIDTRSSGRKIAVVAHSLGGILGTWICRDLGSRIVTYVNVEGNLTDSDTAFSSRVNRISSAEAAHQRLLSLLWKRGRTSTAYQRYCASVRFADPASLKAWARSGVRCTRKAGEEYLALSCHKTYLWGKTSIMPATRRFLERHRLANIGLNGSGHWPMIDRTDEFYRVVEQLISRPWDRPA